MSSPGSLLTTIVRGGSQELFQFTEAALPACGPEHPPQAGRSDCMGYVHPLIWVSSRVCYVHFRGASAPMKMPYLLVWSFLFVCYFVLKSHFCGLFDFLTICGHSSKRSHWIFLWFFFSVPCLLHIWVYLCTVAKRDFQSLMSVLGAHSPKM